MSEASRIRAFMATASRQAASMVTRKLALGALSGVVMRTPVDTGRARGAWMTSIGSPKGRETGVLDKGGTAAISAGVATIAQQKDFEQVVIENNVPYIGRLEDGSSRQAPNGMAALTLSELGLSPGRD